MITICIYYKSIVQAVVQHEAALKVNLPFFILFNVIKNNKAQAKKMNVESLRSGSKEDEESAEVKIAKVAITNVLLWYLSKKFKEEIKLDGNFPLKVLHMDPICSVQCSSCPGISELSDTSCVSTSIFSWFVKSSILFGSLVWFLAKTACCINPLVFAVSHPKFRLAMATELPCFGIGEKPKDTKDT